MNCDERWLAHYIPLEHLTFTALHRAAPLQYSRHAAELQWFIWAVRPEATQKQTRRLNTVSPALIFSSLPCELAVTVRPAAICRPPWPSTASSAAAAWDLAKHRGVFRCDVHNEKTEERHLDCLFWKDALTSALFPLDVSSCAVHLMSHFSHVSKISHVVSTCCWLWIIQSWSEIIPACVGVILMILLLCCQWALASALATESFTSSSLTCQMLHSKSDM